MKAIRVECRQNMVNYRKPITTIIKETYPLPPYSTLLGMIHYACDYKELHPMRLSIQGESFGTTSDLYTKYSFTPGGKYEADRHQLIADGKYGIFKGIANTELLCKIEMVFHIIPQEEDFEHVFQSLKYPRTFLALGRHEDILDITCVEEVELTAMEEDMISQYDMYIPVELGINTGNIITPIYQLHYQYYIDKKGIRRWNGDNGQVKAYHFPKGKFIEENDNLYIDEKYQTIVALTK